MMQICEAFLACLVNWRKPFLQLFLSVFFYYQSQQNCFVYLYTCSLWITKSIWCPFSIGNVSVLVFFFFYTCTMSIVLFVLISKSFLSISCVSASEFLSISWCFWIKPFACCLKNLHISNNAGNICIYDYQTNVQKTVPHVLLVHLLWIFCDLKINVVYLAWWVISKIISL